MCVCVCYENYVESVCVMRVSVCHENMLKVILNWYSIFLKKYTRSLSLLYNIQNSEKEDNGDLKFIYIYNNVPGNFRISVPDSE